MPWYGYFRTSGFYNLYHSLEDVEKTKVIVGFKKCDEHTWDVCRHARESVLQEYACQKMMNSLRISFSQGTYHGKFDTAAIYF
jgi:hypothetical protein